MIDDLRSLRAFVTTAEELNFRRAAERLHMSQPPLSRMIAALEDTLETRLFERSTRQVSLTQAGELLYREATGLLERADELARMLKRETGVRRRFKIGCTAAAYCTSFPQIVARLRELHPEVEIELHEMNSDAQLDGIASAKLDAGIVVMPVRRPGIAVLPFSRMRMRMAVPAAHPLAGSAEPVALGEFSRDVFIVHAREENPAMYHEIMHHCAKAGFRPRVLIKKKGQNCMAMIASGAGVHFSAAHGQCLRVDGVSFVELEGEAPVLEMGFACRDGDGTALMESLRGLLGMQG
ncbi:LysR family transcriptional regulator [Luteolibacter luteus]|uniref:LysR family transcriptional regulator n=1 Tax=Luteolibacter luteus TaxID=2728835 RepID=A0A858RJ61_9BACT|nr:LysR family transcriptional regulator [Luteolibacter luteus]QJE96250.1 LysR family transcriptional regulator [Luteolibacter luteus]